MTPILVQKLQTEITKMVGQFDVVYGRKSEITTALLRGSDFLYNWTWRPLIGEEWKRDNKGREGK